MPAITPADLNNAKRDADDLALIVNGADDAADVNTRLGEVVPPVAKVIAVAGATITTATATVVAAKDDALVDIAVAITATEDAKDAAVIVINNTRDGAVDDVNDTKDAAVVTINSTRDTAVGLVNTAKDEAIVDINDAVTPVVAAKDAALITIDAHITTVSEAKDTAIEIIDLAVESVADEISILSAAAAIVDTTRDAAILAVEEAGDIEEANVAAVGTVWVANVTAAAAADFYASTAAGVAAVAEGGFFNVVVGNNIAVYRDLSGVAVLQATIPGLTTLEISSFTLPAGIIEAWVDQYERLGPRITTDGSFIAPSIEVTEGGTIQGLDGDILAFVITKGLENIRYKEPAYNLEGKLLFYSQNGQSDSEGADSDPAISTVAKEGLLMFEKVRVRHEPTLTRFTTGLRSMIEENYYVGADWGETPVYGTGEMFLNKLEIENRITPAKGEFDLLGVSTGVSSSGLASNNYLGASGSWAMFEAACDYAVTQAAARGQQIEYMADFLRIAATDYDLGTTKVAYRALLDTRRSDLLSRIKPKFVGQTRDPKIIIVQDHHHPSRGYPFNPYIAEAQYEFCAANSDHCYIAGPQYAMFYEFSNSHHSARESKITGGWQGTCLKKTWIDREPWDNGDIKTAVAISSDLIELTYGAVANTKLIFDCKEIGLVASSAGAQPAYGLEVLTSAGANLTIKGNPWIHDYNKIRIRMAAPLTNSGETVTYGRNTYGGNIKRVPNNALLNFTLSVNSINEPIEQWACIMPRLLIAQ